MQYQNTINNVRITMEAEEEHAAELNRLAGALKSIQPATSDRDLELLDPAFRESVKTLLARCVKNGFILKPFFTLRSPWKQARLWRQSRPITEIQTAIRKLQKEHAPFLAHVLSSVGPQNGRWATNALPGQSWHQWGLAVDCFLATPRGQALWSGGHEGYRNYADEALKLGLVPGFYWDRQDSVHVQQTASTVRALHTWPDIDAEMLRLFEVRD
jgi:hypothetical protein